MSPASFLGPAIAAHVATHGRVFLRNVRHGLYLVPLAVEANIGIGCPVDPAFALGGERHKNPYSEKLEIAARDGVAVDDESVARSGADVDGRTAYPIFAFSISPGFWRAPGPPRCWRISAPR